MKPKISETSFGSITIDGKTFGYDVIIRLEGTIEKRKKKLSKKIYGTSHTISLDEAKYFFEKNAELIIIGSGQYGAAELSNEAVEYFKKKDCKIILKPTAKATKEWNNAEGKIIGLFHITC